MIASRAVSSGGFPTEWLEVIRCPRDGGALALAGPSHPARVSQGAAICRSCGTAHPIRDGILSVLDPDTILDERSRYEMSTRGRQAAEPPALAGRELELEATLRHFGPAEGRSVLELGCGTGVYTRALASRGAAVLAVDFSRAALRENARALPGHARVALLHADVTHLALVPGVFDRALSTLYSNLPSEAVREAANRVVAGALGPDGRFVVTAHHHDVRRRLRRLRPSGTYESGIFYQCFTQEELQEELGHTFGRVSVTGISITLPYLSRVRRFRSRLSAVSELVPLARSFASLLLAACVS